MREVTTLLSNSHTDSCGRRSINVACWLTCEVLGFVEVQQLLPDRWGTERAAKLSKIYSRLVGLRTRNMYRMA